jgi:hypothetical protein
MRWLVVVAGLAAASSLTCSTGPNCAETCQCKTLGWCSRIVGTKCGAETDAQCKQSTVCDLNGKCTAKNGRCVATKLEDCKASRACRDARVCNFDGNRCVY